jgi:hypothetical protein
VRIEMGMDTEVSLQAKKKIISMSNSDLITRALKSLSLKVNEENLIIKKILFGKPFNSISMLFLLFLRSFSTFHDMTNKNLIKRFGAVFILSSFEG